MFCPKCGSGRVRRSRTRSSKEKILKFFGYIPFRCREENCNWRDMIRVSSLKEMRINFLENYRNHIIFFIMFIITIYFVLKIIHAYD